VLLDGELTVVDADGRPDFAAVMARRGDPRRARAPRERGVLRLEVWDLLHLDGASTRSLPYFERRAALESLGLAGPHWATPPNFVGQAHELFAVVVEHDLEGVVIKPMGSIWRPGSRGPWIKHKAVRSCRRVAIGEVPPKGGEPAGFVVARAGAGGALSALQVVRFGLQPGERVALRRALARGERVAVDVRGHGRSSGMLRDATLAAIVG
jgi:bifunctional non-homologous end joining protein LigD